MTIKCEKVATSLEEGIKNIVETAKLDYAKWTGACSEKAGARGLRSDYFQRTLDEFEDKIEVREGQNYIKVIRDNSVHCFVIKKLTAKTEAKGFKVGDILKPAGWQAPALNKPRGNVFEGFFMNWTGPLYLS